MADDNSDPPKPERTPLQRFLLCGMAVVAGGVGFAAIYLLNNKDIVRDRMKKARKGPEIEVKLAEGETLGDLIVKYVGDYTTYNIDTVRNMNKKTIKDLNLLQPGQIIKLPDNRKGVYEPTVVTEKPKASMFKNKEEGTAERGEGAPSGSKGGRTAAKARPAKGSRSDLWTDPLDDVRTKGKSKAKVRLLQDDW